MPSFRKQGTRNFAARAVLLAILVFLFGAAGTYGQTNSNPPATTQDDSSFRLKATSNLVVLRVVVRDAQGKPVGNLKKEDFKLFDRGKEQTITQFEEEAPTAASSAPISAAGRATRQPTPSAAPAPAAPVRFLALYFDDLNTSDADMVQSRDAADHYLAANLQPQDRVAIFTSTQVLSDFTSDPKQIHQALFKLQASARNLARAHYCPDLSDYQAQQIVENPNGDAMGIAMDEAAHCDGGVLIAPGAPMGGGGGAGSIQSAQAGGAGAAGGGMSTAGGGGIAGATIRELAQNIVNQYQIQTRANFHQLEQVVKYISQKSGQHTVILVSPGFMSASEQLQLDRLIDNALRSQVVISALDPKGLAILMSQMDTSRSYVPINPGMSENMRRLESQREVVATAVLADVAYGTGGEFFHNSNDLKGGFGALAGSPIYYTLAFVPRDIQPDGKFHALKVTLAEKEKGFSIQARRGYFAAKNGAEPETEEAEAKPIEAKPPEPKPEALTPEAQAQKQMQEAILSKTDVAQFPVALQVKLAPGQGDTHELDVSAHLDAAPLHFRKEGDHNLNTVTFVFAVFDQKDTLINAQQRRASVNVADAELPNFLKGGVNVNATFQLKSGSYRVREVVTDSEDHHISTLSRNVDIP